MTSILYWCRNDTVCLKRFETEEELSQHLEVIIFTSDELKSFTKSILEGSAPRRYYVSHCISCNMNIRREKLDWEGDFRHGCLLPMVLTPEVPRGGLSKCVAEIVSTDILDGMCGSCRKTCFMTKRRGNSSF